MNSQDDPEARIRQLEQSAADQAPVELGTEQTSSAGAGPTAPLPPPVGPYGTTPYDAPAYGAPPSGAPPYGTPPYGTQPFGDAYQPPPGTVFTPMPGKGTPVGLVVGLIAVVAIVIFGGIGLIVWNVVSATGGSISTREGGETSFAGSGGSVDTPAEKPTESAPGGLPGIPDVSALPTAPPSAQVTISGIEENKTIACTDSAVSISGVDNTVTITGHCVSVSVSGMRNQVTVDASDSISASGFENRIIYHSGSPQIDNFGGNNIIEQG
jgi:hypothetical protein